ncbi:MAG TPA: hypothetical protein VK171_07765 [Fimbriimonas sp.]|nr:hypothetical protein [Fimbriimonas sp.]
MVSPVHQEVIDQIEEPRKSELLQVHNLITSVVPNWEQWIVNGHLGFGKYTYKGASGREGEWFNIALKPLKNEIGIYVCAVGPNGSCMAVSYADKLGKASIGQSCIRVKSISTLNLDELKNLFQDAKRVVEGG